MIERNTDFPKTPVRLDSVRFLYTFLLRGKGANKAHPRSSPCCLDVGGQCSHCRSVLQRPATARRLSAGIAKSKSQQARDPLQSALPCVCSSHGRGSARSSAQAPLGSARPRGRVADPLGHYGLTARSNPFASATNAQCQIQYIIGSTNVPQTPIKFGVSETWLNTQAFLHQLDDIDNPSRCTLANWSAPNYTAAGAAQGTFAFGQNFCSFIGKTSSMTSGMNTINSPIFLNVQMPASVTTAQRIDTFVLYDVILDISDNGLMCRF